MNTDTDICLGCGKAIEPACRQSLFGMVRQQYCLPCGFGLYWKSVTSCRKPFKDKIVRYKKDGSIPESCIQEARLRGIAL